MEKNKKAYIYPELFSLLMIILLIFTSLSLEAEENSNYPQYEKIYNTLEIETLEHQKMRLNDLSSPIVIVNFWASWCIPCLEEIPSLIKLSEKYKKDELSIVVINTDQENQLMNIAKIQKKLNFPKSFINVPDQKFKIADTFKFSAIPVTIIFKKGKVIYFSNGPVDFLKVL